MKGISIASCLVVLFCLCTFSVYAGESNQAQSQANFIGEQDGSYRQVNVVSYLSVSCYFPVVEVRKSKGGIMLFFAADVQGQSFVLSTETSPGQPDWKNLKDVKPRDFIWATVGEDGKILEINKKKPIKIRKR